MNVTRVARGSATTRSTAAEAEVISWRQDRAGLAAAAGLAGVCFLLGWLRYSHHWADAYDVGLFDQGIWLLSQGRNPQLTVIDDHLFADHLSLVLLAFAPLYRIVASPLWMVAAQALAIGTAVLQLRTLAREAGVRPRWATVATVASSPLLAAAAYDFHPVVMTVPVIAWALVVGRRDDVGRCTIACVLVGLIRADAAVLLLGVAVMAAPAARRRLITLALPILLAGLFVPVLAGSDQSFSRYYAGLGTSPLDALAHPWRAASVLASPLSLRRIFIWLMPAGFLMIHRPRWLLALAVGGLPLLLSSNPATAEPVFHHAATITPFAIGGALEALGRADRPWLHPATLVVGVVTALALVSPFSPVTPADWNVRSLRHDRGTVRLPLLLEQVQPTDRVVAEPFLVPPLAHRAQIYPWRCQSFEGTQCPVRDLDPTRFDIVVGTTSRADEIDPADWLVCQVPDTDFILARPKGSVDRCPVWVASP